MATDTFAPVFSIPPDPEVEARRDAQAEAEIDAGLGVPHGKVRDWLLKLAEGERLPPPVA